MDRRAFLAATALPLTLAVTRSVARAATPAADGDGFEAASTAFVNLPGDKSFVIEAPGRRTVSLLPDAPRFVGSAVKTFILATFLREVEAGRLSESALMAIDDGIRSLSSSVFGAHPKAEENLAGMASARTVLEAMISHSDNTATDAALEQVGADKVRAFIARTAGLSSTRIPDSTRRMFSYLAGAKPGVDVGWAGMKRILDDHYFGEPRAPINERQTMISTAAEMVGYYRRALAGEFFAKPETLTEFKRIQATGDVIARVVPANTVAWAKGGSIDWNGFHALCAAGQMVVGPTPITFCFTINWKESTVDVKADFSPAVAAMLAAFASGAG